MDAPTIAELEALLRANGHTIKENDEARGRLLIAPEPDAYMTLARRVDVVLYRIRRRVFFLCKPDSPAIFAGSVVPEGLRGRWRGLEAQAIAGYRDILASLAAWTLARLIPHDRAFVWAEKPNGYYPDYRAQLYGEIEEWLGTTVGSDSWRAHLDGDPSANVLALDTASEEFPFILAAYFLHASQHFAEIWFATGDGREAYQMHHHDKVVISVPEAAARDRIVADFQAKADVYEDASDYELFQEPEDMTEEEWWEGT